MAGVDNAVDQRDRAGRRACFCGGGNAVAARSAAAPIAQIQGGRGGRVQRCSRCRCRAGRADRGGRAAAAGGGVPDHRPAGAGPAVREGGRHPAAHAGDLGGIGAAAAPRWTRRSPMRGPAGVRQRRAGRPAGPARCPPDVPYGFVALPQYETERMLAERLAELRRPRSSAASSWSRSTQDADGVTAQLAAERRARRSGRGYLVGCDGAHSVVRKGLGLSSRAGRSPRSTCSATSRSTGRCPTGYGDTRDARDRRAHRRRAGLHPAARDAGATGCRCWCPAGARQTAGRRGDGRARHRGRPGPRCPHPGGAGPAGPGADDGAHDLRWSSVFRISHRIVDRYGRRAGVHRRRRRAHPSADRRAGHEHRHPGRVQPGLEARPGRPRGGRATGCSTATTPSATRSARRSSGAPCATPARASRPTRTTPPRDAPRGAAAGGLPRQPAGRQRRGRRQGRGRGRRRRQGRGRERATSGTGPPTAAVCSVPR